MMMRSILRQNDAMVIVLIWAEGPISTQIVLASMLINCSFVMVCIYFTESLMNIDMYS